jgi:hypothetical protein
LTQTGNIRFAGPELWPSSDRRNFAGKAIKNGAFPAFRNADLIEAHNGAGTEATIHYLFPGL